MLYANIEVDKLLEAIPVNDVVAEIRYLRNCNKLKLNELQLDIRTFKYLKKLGVFSSFLQSDSNGSRYYFNLTERMLLKIAEVLWRYGYKPEVIKSILDGLLLDNLVSPYINARLLSDAKESISRIVNNKEEGTFLEYAVIEHRRKPNLRTFINLEGLLITAIAVDPTISFIIDNNSNWGVVNRQWSTQEIINQDGKSCKVESFVNITIRNIVDSYVHNLDRNSPILNPSAILKRTIDTLIKKGFGLKTMRDVEFDGIDTNTTVIELEPRINISKVKTQYSNQDILIKVREFKVASIQQLVIKKKHKL
jgi:hypothetical protein